MRVTYIGRFLNEVFAVFAKGMIVLDVKSRIGLQAALAKYSGSIGFVPVTFDVHEGHLSLIRRARAENVVVVVSRFSCIRFGPNGFFARYPHKPKHDRDLIRSLGVDILFNVGSFPPEDKTWVEIKEVNCSWEGSHYPEHFRNVATCLKKLFLAVRPDRAYFGEKDYEQLQITKGLAAEFFSKLVIVDCATVRDTDGLALSASNVRLTPDERPRANALYLALRRAQDILSNNQSCSATMLQDAMLAELVNKGLAPDYAAIVHTETLLPIHTVDLPVRALIAAYLGSVRLIDNALLIPPS